MACDKRRYGGKRSARRAVRHMHQTVRVYLCEECGYYHVTKRREKGQDRVR